VRASAGHHISINHAHSDSCARNVLQEYYVWCRAPRLRDHLYLHPGKSSLSQLVPRLTGYGQGFGLTIGSEFYLLFNESAATTTDGLAVTRSIEYLTGLFVPLNASMTGAGANQTGFGVSLEIALPPDEAMHMVKGRFFLAMRAVYTERLSVSMCLGCYRDPAWAWWRQPLPAFTMLFLVPIYSFLSTMANLQSYRSRHTPVMVSDVPALNASSFRVVSHYSFNVHHSSFTIFLAAERSWTLNVGHPSILNAPTSWNLMDSTGRGYFIVSLWSPHSSVLTHSMCTASPLTLFSDSVLVPRIHCEQRRVGDF